MRKFTYFLTLMLALPPLFAAWEQTYLAPSDNAAMRPHAQGFYDASVERTFLVHGDENLDGWVTAYDHTAADWIPSVRVTGNFHDDNYHNYTVIAKDAAGYIHAFIGRGLLTHSRSLQPLDIESGWTDEVILENSGGNSIDASYPLPILAENGDFYVFFRSAAHGGNPIHFIKTSDNGATWTDQRHVIEHDPKRADQSSNLYVMGIEHVPAGNGLPERILLCWINAGPGADGVGGYNSARKDVFFAWFNVEDELLYAADGTALGDVIRDDEAEAHCKVYDSGPLGEDRAVNSFSVCSHTDDGGYITAFKDNRNGRVACSYWDGSAWNVVTVKAGLTEDIRVMEIEKTGPNDFLLYINALAGDGSANKAMEIHETLDGGATWSLKETVQPELHSFEIVSLIDDYHPDIRLSAHSFRPGDGSYIVVGENPITPREPSDYGDIGGEPVPGTPGWYKVDDFEREDSTTIGGDWKEGGSANFQISDGQLLVQGRNGSLYLDLPPDRQIGEGTTGTLFFQVTAPTTVVDESMAFGIVDQAGSTNKDIYRARLTLLDLAEAQAGTTLRAEGNGTSQTAFLSSGTTYNVWLVIDNATDSYDLYLSDTSEPGVPLAQNLGFPPGPTTNSLQTLLFITFSRHPDTSDVIFDNIYIDAAEENLTHPIRSGETTVTF